MLPKAVGDALRPFGDSAEATLLRGLASTIHLRVLLTSGFSEFGSANLHYHCRR